MQVLLNGNQCAQSLGGSAAASAAPSALTGGSVGGAESDDSGPISITSNTVTGIQAYTG